MLIFPLIALIQAAPLPELPPPVAPLEGVYAVHRDTDGLTVRVRSNGCTSAASFITTTVQKGDQQEVTLVREQPDYCRALLRDGVAIKWTWAQLGLAPSDAVMVRNPVQEQ